MTTIKYNDLTGRKFERLLVIERVENNKYGGAMWLCRCNCKNVYKVISGSSLNNGKTTSCGCIQRELISKRFKKYNTYDLSGEYGVGYTNKGEEFYFDLEDYNLIKEYCWRTAKDNYIVTKYNNTLIMQHRIITQVSDDYEVDHIYHNKNDNRKEKLRICTRIENSMNQLIAKNNTSGYKGVYFDKKMNQWCVRINVNKKRIVIGYYADLLDAVEIRKKAEEKYFGEYKCANGGVI